MSERVLPEQLERGGAFGDPDGAREDFRRFIAFGAQEAWGGISLHWGDVSARVLVGGKGSGKTFYKRYIEDAVNESNELYLFRQPSILPSTEDVRRTAGLFDQLARSDVISLSQKFEDNLRTEKWQLLWRRAIFKSLSSLFYASSGTPEGLSDRPKWLMPTDEFYRNFDSLVMRKFFVPESITNQVSEIINKYATASSLDAYLKDPRWDSLETVLIKNLRENRPVFYFVDSVDEEFRHAPSYWMDCQKGLFYTVMHLLREERAETGLHVCICIRDLVYASILRTSEHATRYVASKQIRILHWGRKAASLFLRRKVESLPAECLMRPNDDTASPIKRWLGHDSVSNVTRQIEESLESYILRHTRLLPRDLVIVGNELCNAVLECKANGRELDHSTIREVVSKVAKAFARETILICGNHLAVSSLPRFGLNAHFGGDEPVPSDWAATKIEEMIREIGKDVFTEKELEHTLDGYHGAYESDAERTKYLQYRIDTILWQHGLLGFREHGDDEACVFYNTYATNDFFLPKGKERYVFHPSLVDLLSIRPIGKHPIG